MKLENFIIGTVMFGVVFVVLYGTGGFYSEFLTKYDVEIDNNDAFGKVAESIKTSDIMTVSDDINDKISGGTVSDEDALDEMVAGGYKSIKQNPYTVLKMAGNATTTITKETGIVNPNLTKLLITILTVLVSFAIIYLIFRFAPHG